MDRKATHKSYQRSNSEEVEVNTELFYFIRKRNISTREKLQEVQKLLGKIPRPDINAQDGNDNCNTALHLAIKRNELEVVNFLLTQGADTTLENGDGKTPLNLAEEHNQVEIIDALKSLTSQVEWPPSGTDRLESHISQPAEANPKQVSVFHSDSHAAATGEQAASTFLPPFSNKLEVDKMLKLSHADFKQKITKFHEIKQLSEIDQLKATPPYPTPHVLAQFASMAYSDCKHGEPTPPDSWQLLTTASHFGISNGYFGTAYWHPEHQQVVIAHRGTDIKNVGALVTDVKGVLFNNYVNQTSSASTFANQVVAVLQEIEQENKVDFELFFTGHSLGGWLAQITTFTTEHLEVKGGTFLKNLKTKHDEPFTSSSVHVIHYVRESYHPHTVVFDSPGCKDMLSQMADKLDIRLKGRSINLQHLDITSYLSAPNFINTCNAHLGTVYRIFIDLSDMGWKERHTPLYNLATHSMDKIKQAFDPETGQVRRDEKGELKILEVVDWPVTTGLKGGAKLNDFFKWAKHLNNYHTNVMDISYKKVPKGYLPLHYQTKAYDTCKKSLNVFTQDEREFLERYLWLRRMPELFKPEDLFCVMSDAEAEKEAEQKLRNFELGTESVCSPEARQLHVLISYVNRMVRNFPELKEKVKDKLSSAQIRNRVYQYETQRYAEKIRQRALDFNSDAMDLREFLTSDQQIWQLRMLDGDAWTGITKVYRVLQNTSCTPNYSSEGHYTILELEWMLKVSRIVNLNALLAEIETPHLLMIACDNIQPVNGELENIFGELFNILENKEEMKIILTVPSEESTADFIQQIATETLGEGFITTDEELKWSDLTARSQTAMLEKTVIFQGRPVALNQLISAESMTDSFLFSDLLQENNLKIGEEPVPSAGSGYNEKYYIDRTFNHNIVIRQDILGDKREGKFEDFLACTEQEFKHLCVQNPKSNVHWLVKEKSGDLVWQQSQGNFKKLRKYIYDQKSYSYSLSDLDNLLQQAKQQRLMLIAGTAGMGKTTVLTHLFKKIKETFPTHWLVRIDLNDYTELLEAQKERKMDKGDVVDFISTEVLKLESRLEKELFKKSFEGNEISKLVVMVDGLDVTSPDYKETVMDMLQFLKQTSLEQLWVTTRLHLKEELEDNLQQLSYILQPFSDVEQVEFLKKFWSENLNLDLTNQQKLQIYVTALIGKWTQSISDEDKEFTGIPLQTRMLAEAFAEHFLSYYHSGKPETELQHKLDLLGLFCRFIENKYDIFYKGKSKVQASNMGAVEVRYKYIQLEHQLLALEALFIEEELTFLQNDYIYIVSDEELARIGIVQRNNEGKLQFIHHSFAEYFVAEFLIKQLTKETKQHTQVQDILLNKVLLRKDCKLIRSFLDGLLEKIEPSNEALKEYGEKLKKLLQKREEHGTLEGVTTALHTAAEEDNVSVIGFLLESLKSGEGFSSVTEMLLATDCQGRTALHKAAENDSVQALKKIWEWAGKATTWKAAAERGNLEAISGHSATSDTTHASVEEEELQPNRLKKFLFVAKDQYGNTAWHAAAHSGSLKAFETLWIWAKEENLNPDELLLVQGKDGNTAWQLAAQTGHLKFLQKLEAWAKEVEVNPNDLKYKLLLAKDKNGYTVWHRAAESGNLEALETLWFLVTVSELKPDEMLLDEDEEGNTAWQVATQKCHFEVLKKLWEWANGEQMGANVLKDKLLLAKDQYGNTAWNRAAEIGNLETLETLWNWAKEVEIDTDELKKNLLLVQDKQGETAWHVTADRRSF